MTYYRKEPCGHPKPPEAFGLCASPSGKRGLDPAVDNCPGYTLVEAPEVEALVGWAFRMRDHSLLVGEHDSRDGAANYCLTCHAYCDGTAPPCPCCQDLAELDAALERVEQQKYPHETLAAAAPELLEAAKTAEAELETVLAFVAENDGAAFNAAERALFDLRLAIAKAEGREEA